MRTKSEAPIARNTGEWVHFTDKAGVAPMQIKDPTIWGPYRAYDEDPSKCIAQENGEHIWLDQARRHWPAIWKKSRQCAGCCTVKYS